MTDNYRHNSTFLYFISYLQIIGIVLVVLGHSFHEYDEFRGTDLLYSFHMPLFLFVSGFLLVYTSVYENKFVSVGHFVAKKCKRLLIPFIFLSTITFVPRALMNGVADDAITLSVKSFIDAFIYADSFVIPFYWYLYTCFSLLVVTYTTIWIAHRTKWCSIPVALAVLLCLIVVLYVGFDFNDTDFLSLNNTINKGAFFVLGAIYCCYYDVVERLFGKLISSPIFALVCGSIWGLLFFIGENTDLILVCSLFGILMCVSIAKFLVATHVTVLDHLQGSSYMIFLLSWYFNVTSQQLLAHFTNFPWWSYSILSLLTGIYGPWLIHRYLRRHVNRRFDKTLLLLLGQSSSVSKV